MRGPILKSSSFSVTFLVSASQPIAIFQSRLRCLYPTACGMLALSIGHQPLPSIDEVFSEVRRDKSRRLMMLGTKISTGAVNLETSALDTCEANADKKIVEKPFIYCDACKKPYHTRETCWKIHGKPANKRAHSIKTQQLMKQWFIP